jgi:cell division protein FtsL
MKFKKSDILGLAIPIVAAIFIVYIVYFSVKKTVGTLSTKPKISVESPSIQPQNTQKTNENQQVNEVKK